MKTINCLQSEMALGRDFNYEFRQFSCIHLQSLLKSSTVDLREADLRKNGKEHFQYITVCRYQLIFVKFTMYTRTLKSHILKRTISIVLKLTILFQLFCRYLRYVTQFLDAVFRFITMSLHGLRIFGFRVSCFCV